MLNLYEETPVHRVEPGSPVQIDCAEGSISAAKVLLTTNAFITRLDFLRHDVFPLIGCASLSRPLTEDEQASMGGCTRLGNHRLCDDSAYALSNRIWSRHGTRYTGDFRLDRNMRERIQASHIWGLCKRYPMLNKLTFDYTWPVFTA